jgi:DNA-binding NtrC family response regulator
MVWPNAMVVAQDLEIQQALASGLGQRGVTTVVASTVAEAEAILNHHLIALVFCSDELTNDGIERLLRPALRPQSSAPVIVVSRCDDWKRYLDFLQAGAFDYVLHPPSGNEIKRVLHDALNSRHLASLDPAATVQPDYLATPRKTPVFSWCS